MDLVQWIVPQPDGSLAVGFAPAWSDRMPAVGTLGKDVFLRRRGAPLVSRWLPYPMAVGHPESDVVDDDPIRPHTSALTIVVRFAAEGGQPLLPPNADDVRAAGLFAELVRVVVDLAEAAGIPASGVALEKERRGLEIVVTALGLMTARQLADALVLLRASTEACAQARGLSLADARIILDDKSAALDGKIKSFLSVTRGRPRSESA
jgi:hypothetical protein